MRAQLLEKIERCLREPLDREMQVVYLIVEIRKFLEQNRLRRRYPSLNFHCCWAVHSKAKGLGSDRIIRRFDEVHQYYPHVNTAPPEAIARIGRTMGLQTLKIELRRFLSSQSLPCAIVDDSNAWMRFLGLYFSVIEDCPFVLTPNSDFRPIHLSEIIVTRLPIPLEGPEMTVGSYWRLIGIDGQEVGKYINLFTESEVPEWAEPFMTILPSGEST